MAEGVQWTVFLCIVGISVLFTLKDLGLFGEDMPQQNGEDAKPDLDPTLEVPRRPLSSNLNRLMGPTLRVMYCVS